METGPYAGAVLITSDGGNGAFNVTVNIITHKTPWLAFYPQTCYFGKISENSIQTTTFKIWNSGTGTLHYTLSCGDAWVTVSPADGSSTGEQQTITVTINTSGMTHGATYQAYVDIDSNGGNKVFFVWFIIGTEPNIAIKSVSGGMYRISAVITNTGTADAIGVDWNIELSGNGLIILGKETKGKLIGVPMGKEKTITSGFILGVGSIIVSVKVQNSEAIPIHREKTAQLLLFYIKM
jgi:hypothetical protein